MTRDDLYPGPIDPPYGQPLPAWEKFLAGLQAQNKAQPNKLVRQEIASARREIAKMKAQRQS